MGNEIRALPTPMQCQAETADLHFHWFASICSFSFWEKKNSKLIFKNYKREWQCSQVHSIEWIKKETIKLELYYKGQKGHWSEREVCNASCFSWYRKVMPQPLLSLCASSKTSQWHRRRSSCGARRPVTPEGRDGGEQSGSGEFRGCGTTAYMLDSAKLTKLEEEISWSRCCKTKQIIKWIKGKQSKVK